MEIEWIILADHADVVGNKLYLLGGGWESLTINSGFPAQHQFAIAVSFQVAWTETNTRHDFSIEIADQDGAALASAVGQFEVGRPVGLPAGSNQRFQFAANLGMSFPKPGTYVVNVRAGNAQARHATFNVIAGPMIAMRQQARPG